MENYTIYDEIGRGPYSFVYKARRKRSIEYVAVKSTAKLRMEKILNEVQILHKLDSRHVLKFYNWYESQNHIWLIFEYCIGGDLLNLITQDLRLSETTVKTFGWELVAGLCYLHTNGILYCDLKPANVLIDECGSLKLADFGLARRIPTEEMMATTALAPGSPNYMAPELFRTPALHSFASDFWSLGCVLYELCIGRPPFMHTNYTELARAIQTESFQISQQEHSVTLVFIDLLHRLLEKDPYKRITWDELLHHPFWSGCSTPIVDLPLPEQELFEASRPPSQGELRAESMVLGIPEPCFTDNTQDAHAAISPATKSASDESTTGSTRQSEDEKGNDHEDDLLTDIESQSEDDDRVRASTRPRPITAALAKPSAKMSDADQPPRTAPSISRRDQRASSQQDDSHRQLTLKRSSRLLFTPADSVVKPIAFSNDMENVSPPHVRPELLDFEVTTTERLLRCTTEDLEDHLKSIYISLKATDHSPSQKASVLAHLFSLCQQNKLANVIVNSSLFTLLIKMLRQLVFARESVQHDDQELASTIAHVLGALFRFATFMASTSPELLESLASSLTEMILRPRASKGRAVNSKRRAASCLGEFVFYMATQKADDLPIVGVRCLLESIEDEDVVTRHYAVRAIANILSQCTNETVLVAVVHEQLVSSLVRALVDAGNNTDSHSVVLQTTTMQAIVQIFRHLRFPVLPSTARSFLRTKEAALTMISKKTVLAVLWDSVVSGQDALDLAAVSLNVLNSYLEMSVDGTLAIGQSSADVVTKHKQVLLDQIVDVDVLAAIITSKSIAFYDKLRKPSRQAHRGHSSSPSRAAVRYAEVDPALPSLVRAKAILFMYFGMHRSSFFVRRCIEAKVIHSVEQVLAPYASLLTSPASPSQKAIEVVSPSPLKKIVPTELYVVQCSLHLVRFCIRTALKMGADCISSSSRMDYGDGSDDSDQHKTHRRRPAIASEPFELFGQLISNSTCRTQLVTRFLTSEGREFKFFIRLMSTLLSSFSTERLTTMDTRVGVVVTRLLRQLFQDSSSSEAAALVELEAKEAFSHLLPALVVQLEQHSHSDQSKAGDDEDDDASVNCIQLIYMMILHLNVDLSDADCERKAAFIRQHLLPCFAVILSSTSTPLNENVWRFAIDLLHGLVFKHDTNLVDEFANDGLLEPTVSLLSAPKRYGYVGLPSNAAALVRALTERSRKANALWSLYDVGFASHIVDGLEYSIRTNAITSGTRDLLETLYVLLYQRYEELRTHEENRAEEPSRFGELVHCGLRALHLCTQSNSEDDEPQDSPSKDSVRGVAIFQEVLEVASRCLVYISQIFGGRLNEVLFAKPALSTSEIDAKRAFAECLQLTHQHDVVQLRVLLTIKNCLRCDRQTEAPWTRRWLQSDKPMMVEVARISSEPRNLNVHSTRAQTVKAASEILQAFHR